MHRAHAHIIECIVHHNPIEKRCLIRQNAHNRTNVMFRNFRIHESVHGSDRRTSITNIKYLSNCYLTWCCSYIGEKVAAYTPCCVGLWFWKIRRNHAKHRWSRTQISRFAWRFSRHWSPNSSWRRKGFQSVLELQECRFLSMREVGEVQKA